MQKNTENILEKVPEKGIMSKIAGLIKYRQMKDNFIDSVGDETMEQQHMFTNRMIRNLLVPVVLEQILNSIMGTADTMMVSSGICGSFCGVSGRLHQYTSDSGFFGAGSRGRDCVCPVYRTEKL